jgi:hypothetical protein
MPTCGFIMMVDRNHEVKHDGMAVVIFLPIFNDFNAMPLIIHNIPLDANKKSKQISKVSFFLSVPCLDPQTPPPFT